MKLHRLYIYSAVVGIIYNKDWKSDFDDVEEFLQFNITNAVDIVAFDLNLNNRSN